jgi:hypothetical protein
VEYREGEEPGGGLEGGDYSPEEEEELTRTLRGLGYV